MIKDLKSQLGRMTFVLVLMVAMGAWQWDFMVTAINSNIFLNLTIFGTFAFGAMLMYRDVFRLENEVHAFEALKEDYEDTCNVEQKEAADPLWRYYRCNELGTIYKRPSILAHAHQLISEQIARSRSLTISPSTMATLIDGVDARLSDQKSLQQYVTGLLVFLGLIGTFVGLMGTLSSVGDILGALDLTSGDAMGTVVKLMENLKAPLKGMATGFSSSLFGLVTSLTLGIMGRFASKASNDLRMNFEGWLAGVADISENKVNDENGVVVSGGAAVGVEGRQLELLYKVARHTMQANGRMRGNIDKLSEAMTFMVQERVDQRKTDEAILDHLARLAEQQAMMVQVMDRQSRMLQTRDEMLTMMAQLESRSADRQDRIRERIETVGRNIDAMTLRFADGQEQTEPARKVAPEIAEELRESDEIVRQLDEGLRELQMQAEASGSLGSSIDDDAGFELAEASAISQEAVDLNADMATANDDLPSTQLGSDMSADIAGAADALASIELEKIEAAAEDDKLDISELQGRLTTEFGEAAPKITLERKKDSRKSVAKAS